MEENNSWSDITIIAFDLETSGKYPLESQICEIAAVKWHRGKIIDEYQSLVKPDLPMSDTVIAIHNISNKMVEQAPKIDQIIEGFYQFIKDGFLIAHHAPFDMGFLAPEFETAKLLLPQRKVFCSSLLARKLIPESSNHRLQTLVKHLKLEGGTAHRGLDDAKACLQLALECFQRAGSEAKVQEIYALQGGGLDWKNFSIKVLADHPVFSAIVESLKLKSELNIVYKGGSKPGLGRVVKPLGLVRSPMGDFLVATPRGELQSKRYFLNKITKTEIIE